MRGLNLPAIDALCETWHDMTATPVTSVTHDKLQPALRLVGLNKLPPRELLIFHICRELLASCMYVHAIKKNLAVICRLQTQMNLPQPGRTLEIGDIRYGVLLAL